MISLDQLAVNETTTLELVHVSTDEPLGVFITCATPDSAEWSAAEKRYSRNNKKQSLILGKKNEGNRIELDNEIAETNRKVMIECVTDVTGIEGFKFSKAKFDQLVSQPKYKWMLDQLAEHVGSRENYFLESPSPAKDTSA